MIHQAESRREKKSTRVTPHFLSLALDCSRLLAARAFRYAAPLSASRARHRAGHHDRRHRGQEAVRRCPAEEKKKDNKRRIAAAVFFPAREKSVFFVLLAAELWRCSAFLLSLREQRIALRAHTLKGGKSVLLGTTAWRDELKK